MTLNALDWLIVGLCLWAVLEGLHRGLISQLIDLAAFVVSLALAVSYGGDVGTRIDHYLALPVDYRTLIGFLAVLVTLEAVVRVILRLIGHIVPGFVTASLPNRLLGVVPALAKQVVIIALLVNALNVVPQWSAARLAVDESRLAPIALTANGSVRGIVTKIFGPSVPQLNALPD